MSKFIGRLVNVGIGKESSRGTRAAATFTIPKTKYAFDDKANKVSSGESFGNISGMGGQSVVAGRFSEGSLEAEINSNSFGLILLATLGTDTPAAYSTSAYKHTYTLANTNQHTSLSIYTSDPIGITLFKGCMLDTLEIDIKQNEFVTFVAGFKGKKGNDEAQAVPAQVADYKFVGRDLEFKVAANQAALAAATAISVTDVKLTINKNTDYAWVLGTLEPEDILNQSFDIKAEITLNYEDRTVRDYMCNGSYKAMGIKLTDTRDTIGASGNPILYLEFPVVAFESWESNRDNDKLVDQKIQANVMYDVSNSRLISEISITNTTASY